MKTNKVLNILRYATAGSLIVLASYTTNLSIDKGIIEDKVKTLVYEKTSLNSTLKFTEDNINVSFGAPKDGFVGKLVNLAFNDRLNEGINLKPSIENNNVYMGVPIMGSVRKLKIMSLEDRLMFLEVQKTKIDEDGIELLMKTSGLSKFLIFVGVVLLLLREIGIGAIKFYRRFLSSKKSYKCAKGVQTGETCSTTVLNEFQDKGFYSGMKSYYKSTSECKEHNRRYHDQGSGCSAGSGACDANSCDIGDCDVGSC